MTYTLGKSKKISSNVFGAVAIFGTLACAATAFLNPVSYADSNIDVSVNVGSVIAIYTKNNEVELSGKVNSFVSAPLDIYVSTNNVSGYTLTLSAIGTKTDMTSATTTDKLTSSFDGTKTSSSMLDNTWGFSLDNTTYKKIPVETAAEKIKKTTTPTIDPSYAISTVHFGAKIGRILTAGEYSDNVRFTAHVNEVGPEEIPTMQSFDPSTLTVTNKAITLRDARDDKTYTVARLADGNVWMVQNLAFDLNASKELTPEDTDITEDWTPVRSTIAYGNLKSSTWSNNSYTPYSYNSGNSTDGNYYNWAAAVAMNSTSSITSGNATTSICPSGWTLPQNGTGEKTFSSLGAAYGLSSSDSSDATAYQTLEQAPLNFIRTGTVYSGARRLTTIGYYWTSTAYDSSGAYLLKYSDSFYSPQSHDSRYMGVGVRCVAK